MKAVIYRNYGPPEVLTLADIKKPQPKDKEILIKIHATTITAGDCRMRKADPFLVRLISGLFKPKKIPVLGFELAGEVEAIGSKVSKYKAGDLVFAFTGFGFGAYAEYKCLPENPKSISKGSVCIKPKNLSFAQAATIPVGGTTAISFLRKANIQEGHSILIYGASGSVGTFTIQLAKYYGAEVTAVCSTSNLSLVKSLGADFVIDYTKEDFSESDKKYDIVFDAVGKAAKSQCKKVLKTGGTLMNVMQSGKSNPGDMMFLKKIIESGKMKPAIDRTYTLETIQDAHRYVENGHKKGNVSVQIIPEVKQ